MVSPEELGAGVVIECAGHVGTAKRGRQREVLWILWRYEYHSGKWIELVRSQAVTSEWTYAMKDAVIHALHPPDLFDLIGRSREISGKIVLVLDEQLEGESVDVQLNVLSSLYDQVAGRMASLS